MIHKAIYNLYPNVVSINGPSNAMDVNGDSVVIDMNAVTQEAERLEAEAIAQAETKAQLRTSVINKVSATLTSEEKAWLEENL